MIYKDQTIPFQLHGNKRVLTVKQLAEYQWLEEFVEIFHDCFEYDPLMFWLVYNPPEK